MIPFVATDHEISHGREIAWVLRAKQAPDHIREAWSGSSWIVAIRQPALVTESRFRPPTCSSRA